MRAWVSVGASLGIAFLVFACANGTDPTDDGTSSSGGTGTGNDSGSSSYLPPTTDSGSSTRDASSTSKDSGTTTKDSGTTPKDSGTVTPPSGGDCTGTSITQHTPTSGGGTDLFGEAYDDACDAYYNNTGMENACTPGGTDCTALNTSSLTFCCFKPSFPSNCYIDYFGNSECVPK